MVKVAIKCEEISVEAYHPKTNDMILFCNSCTRNFSGNLYAGRNAQVFGANIILTCPFCGVTQISRDVSTD